MGNSSVNEKKIKQLKTKASKRKSNNTSQRLMSADSKFDIHDITLDLQMDKLDLTIKRIFENLSHLSNRITNLEQIEAGTGPNPEIFNKMKGRKITKSPDSQVIQFSDIKKSVVTNKIDDFDNIFLRKRIRSDSKNFHINKCEKNLELNWNKTSLSKTKKNKKIKNS